MRTGRVECAVTMLFAAVFLCTPKVFSKSIDAPSESIPLTLQAGVPIHVALEKSVRIKKADAPVEGRVTEPVYVFDRLLIPSGTKLLGRVTRIDAISKTTRLQAFANGNFSPFHKVHVEFDTLVLQDGKRIPIHTVVSQGAAQEVHLIAGGEDKKKGVISGKIAQVRQQVSGSKQQAIEAVKAPGKLKRVEGMLSAELPYHRQFLSKGTRFVAEVKMPVNLGSEDCPPVERFGSAIPPGSVVHVWLATPLSSATDHKGSPVEALVAQPVFSQDHHLILPEGSRLEGSITTAHPAKRLGRNGQLRFTFRRIELPHGMTQKIEAGLQAVNMPTAAHMKLDSEGGAHATSSKTRYIMPAIDVLLASTSIDGDSERRLIEEGGPNNGEALAGGAVRGGTGFGLVGSLIALAARSQPVSAGFAFYGAAWSVYSHVLARGSEVVFPKDTAMDIRFGTHEGGGSSGQKNSTSAPEKSTPGKPY